MTTEFWKAAFDHQIIESLIWSLPPNYLKGQENPLSINIYNFNDL
jgi:hypothetical protein